MFLNIRKIFLVICFLSYHIFYSQNKGELQGANRVGNSQNYNLSQYNAQTFEGLSTIQILRQQAIGKRNQVIAQKELEKIHFEKQDKPTRKRMKVTLKKSQKWLVNKPIVTKRKVIKQRKIILGQKKLNKDDD